MKCTDIGIILIIATSLLYFEIWDVCQLLMINLITVNNPALTNLNS